MKIDNLKDFTGGWFVGNFHPSVLPTDKFEVAVKQYKAREKERRHMHKEATEITLILDGQALFNGQMVHAGQIVTLEPGEWNTFETLTAVTTVVIKTPSVIGDKYFEE
jgi:mannose-6-phosphate isomerase-like protein (cupin superfamily)